MRKLAIVALSILMIACSDPTYADNHLTETRYCGVPVRNADGSIKRNRAVVREFERLYPLPQGYDRSKWQIDHIIPLANSGCDAIRNLQWLPKTIKTCADDDCKDRWERTSVYPARK